jgi:hypothetical protein
LKILKVKLIIASKVSITIDVWKLASKQSYLGITVQFINKTWEFQSYSLALKYILFDHSSEVLTDMVNEVLDDFNIRNKVCTLVFNNSMPYNTN